MNGFTAPPKVVLCAGEAELDGVELICGCVSLKVSEGTRDGLAEGPGVALERVAFDERAVGKVL